jgi:hypothetical protein
MSCNVAVSLPFSLIWLRCLAKVFALNLMLNVWLIQGNATDLLRVEMEDSPRALQPMLEVGEPIFTLVCKSDQTDVEAALGLFRKMRDDWFEESAYESAWFPEG